MMRSIISLGSKSQPRIFVNKGEQSYVVPYWISKKGNLCWKIGEVLYVKNKWGFTSMLVEGKWVKSNATTKAEAPKPETKGSKSEILKLKKELEDLYIFPDTL